MSFCQSLYSCLFIIITCFPYFFTPSISSLCLYISLFPFIFRTYYLSFCLCVCLSPSFSLSRHPSLFFSSHILRVIFPLRLTLPSRPLPLHYIFIPTLIPTSSSLLFPPFHLHSHLTFLQPTSPLSN